MIYPLICILDRGERVQGGRQHFGQESAFEFRAEYLVKSRFSPSVAQLHSLDAVPRPGTHLWHQQRPIGHFALIFKLTM